MRTPDGRSARWWLPAALFGLALCVRSLVWPKVFASPGVVFAGHDAYYHMRRAIWSLHHFPASLDFDPFVNFPHGARPLWPPFFDLALAGLAWPFYASGGQAAAETALAWFPPVLGALSVAGLYALGRRLFDTPTAVIAALGLAILGAHVNYSQLGFVDHHVAVAFGSLLVYAGAFALDRALRGGDAGVRVAAIGASFGLLLALHLLVWPGGLLHVAPPLLGLWILHARSRRAPLALGAAGCAGLATLLLAATGTATWAHRSFSPNTLSWFQPWLFAALALHAALCELWWRRASPGLARAVLLGVAILAASLALLPDFAAGSLEAAGFISRAEAWQLEVGESTPLFAQRAWAEARLTRALYLAPLAFAALAATLRRRPERLLLVLWIASTAALALSQRRFANSFSLPFALLMAWLLVTSWRGLGGRPTALRAAVGVAVVGLCAWALWPTLALPGRNLRAGVEYARGQPIPISRAHVPKLALVSAAAWLRENSPEPAPPYARTADPTWGVLAGWDAGHILKYVAERPSVVGNFGVRVGADNLAVVERYFASDEAAAAPILASLRARYVLVRPGDDPPDPRSDALARQLGATHQLRLAQYRLVYETPPIPGVSPRARPLVRIFEHVPGARVEGRAPAGEEVVARLAMRTNGGRQLSARLVARADAEGRWRLRLPYSNGAPAPGSAIHRDSWKLSAGEITVDLEVPLSAVLRGEALVGPDLRAPVGE